MPGKKFRFDLQNVLEVRHHRTQEAKRDLADAKRELRRREKRLETARRRFRQRQTGTSEETIPVQLRRKEASRTDARRALNEAQEAVAEQRRRVEDIRSRLRERLRAEKALEKLREKKKRQHQEEQLKAEIDFFDEQATTRHALGTSPGMRPGGKTP